MATSTLITVPVYAINSTLVDRSLYPYGRPIAFAGATLNVQPNTSTGTVNSLEAARQSGAALVYSSVLSSVTGTTTFYSNLTVAQIITLANA